uniref:AB hydrolase-1 domain-containing protein n=1 Tax=Chaetoceros debilis TaxID=122233 RepID=A0A7S3V5A9_9STRA|mmetsp:Transcript_16791/g.24642  ORF Transcript_16791/g.24642 Transcript_16791/m.24642 type:complete len:466 (+) Transcript_16791:88-1485(+)
MINGIRLSLRTLRCRVPASLVGGGNRIYTNGSGIGTDSSMISSNHRCQASASMQAKQYSTLASELGRTKNITMPETTAYERHFSDDGDGMDDEYGEMTADGHTYVYPQSFKLENGQELPHAQIRYMTYGTLNESRDNVLVVCHALTGNASLHSWWGDLLGPGLAFDTDKYFVVCCNILGSCYGSSGPATPINGKDGEVYGIKFPDISVQDTVKLQLHMLQDDLKINSVKCVIGGSFGGMQTVEYAAQAGSVASPFAVDDESGSAAPFVRSVMPIACGAAHTAWQIALSEVQRQAIYADPKWNNGNPSLDDPPTTGLSVARQMGMISYRTPRGYDSKFGRNLREEEPAYGAKANWEVKSYLEYQGYKFLSRFDPITYTKLTEQMDSHDVGRGRGGRENALTSIRIPAKILGIDSDILYPLEEQEELAKLFPNGELGVIKSDAGHDGFLLEQDQVAEYITEFLNSHD